MTTRARTGVSGRGTTRVPPPGSGGGGTGSTGATGATGTPGATNSTQVTNLSSLDGANVTLALNNAARPYRAEYYVDPAGPTTFKNGSPQFPFATIAAAFAAAAAAGYTSAKIWLPTGVSITENVVFPSTGGFWEISGMGDGVGIRSTITGTCVCTSATQSIFILNNIILTGALTGDATSAAGNFLVLRDTQLSSSVTLTRTGSGAWFVDLIGQGTNFFAFGGCVIGDFSAPFAQVFASNWFFGSLNINTGTGPSIFDNVVFSNVSGTTITIASLGLTMTNCGAARPITITAAAATLLSVDGYTAKEFFRLGVTVSPNVVMKTAVSNTAVRSTVANTVLATELNGAPTAHQPLGLYECNATLTLLIAGTAGTLVLNVIFTDLNGVLQTLPVTSGLLISGALAEASGSVTFSHNGATSIAYSVTGVITPGLLSYSIGAAIRRCD